MAKVEQNEGVVNATGRKSDGPLFSLMANVIGGVTKAGLDLASLPLAVLPPQVRSPVQNALHDLTHSLARLPRDMAVAAGSSIDEWAADDDGKPVIVEQPVAVSRPTAAPVSKPPAAVAPPAPVETVSVSFSPPAEPAPPAAPPAPVEAASVHVAVMPAAVETPTVEAPTSAPAAKAPVEVPVAAPAVTIEETPVVIPVQAPEVAPEQPAAAVEVAQPTVEKSSTGAIEIAHVEVNLKGSDLLGEHVTIRNSSDSPVDLKGWMLRDNTKNSYTFPSFKLAPGAEVKVWTKKGSNNAGNLHWGRSRTAWSHEGGTAYLFDAKGTEVARYHYETPTKSGQ